MRRAWRVLVVLGAPAVSVAVATPPAMAACHFFNISVAPASVAEGGVVTVTVFRDGEVLPSAVDVTSIDETATAGADYQAVARNVDFVAGTQQTFDVSITNDPTPEAAETFRLHLSNPTGCSGGLAVGPDATVTIAANDAVPSTTTSTTAATTSTASSASTSTTAPAPSTSTTQHDTNESRRGAVPGETTSTEASTTSSAEPGDDESTSTSGEDGEQATADLADERGGGGGRGPALAVLVVAVAALGGGGLILARRRAGATSDSPDL
ncbi:MAG: Calx-beta domain-containing protein [Actinomycetota bacterium]